MIGDILQPTHLLFILVIALLVLGPKRLPEAGRALGRGRRDFRRAISGDDHEPLNAAPVESAPQPATVVAPVTPATTTPSAAEDTESAEPVPAPTAEPTASVAVTPDPAPGDGPAGDEPTASPERHVA